MFDCREGHQMACADNNCTRTVDKQNVPSTPERYFVCGRGKYLQEKIFSHWCTIDRLLSG